MDSGPYLNEFQVAERWGMSHKTLQRWRVERKGPDFLKIGGTVRYRLCDVEEFEQTRFTKCDGVRLGNAKLRVQEDKPQEAIPRYRTLKDALAEPAPSKISPSPDARS